MGFDRFVRWRGKVPSRDDIGNVLKDYIAGGGRVTWDADRWFVTLLGAPSLAVRSQFPADAPVQHRLDGITERMFEVYPSQEYLDVITRPADEFTYAVAEGFADLCVRLFHAIKQGEGEETVAYKVVLEPDTSRGGFTVFVPAFPGCMSHGDTVPEALANIVDAALLWCAGLLEDGKEIPADLTDDALHKILMETADEVLVRIVHLVL